MNELAGSFDSDNLKGNSPKAKLTDASISKNDIISTSLSTVSSFAKPDLNFFLVKEITIVMDPATLSAEVTVASTCNVSCSSVLNAMVLRC